MRFGFTTTQAAVRLWLQRRRERGASQAQHVHGKDSLISSGNLDADNVTMNSGSSRAAEAREEGEAIQFLLHRPQLRIHCNTTPDEGEACCTRPSSCSFPAGPAASATTPVGASESASFSQTLQSQPERTVSLLQVNHASEYDRQTSHRAVQAAPPSAHQQIQDTSTQPSLTPMSRLLNPVELSQIQVNAFGTAPEAADHERSFQLQEGAETPAGFDLQSLDTLLDAHKEWGEDIAWKCEGRGRDAVSTIDCAGECIGPDGLDNMPAFDTSYREAASNSSSKSQAKVSELFNCHVPGFILCLLPTIPSSLSMRYSRGYLRDSDRFWQSTVHLSYLGPMQEVTGVEEVMREWGFKDRQVAEAFRRASTRRLSNIRERRRLDRHRVSTKYWRHHDHAEDLHTP